MKHKLKLRQAEIKDERENNAGRDKSRLLVKANHMSDFNFIRRTAGLRFAPPATKTPLKLVSDKEGKLSQRAQLDVPDTDKGARIKTINTCRALTMGLLSDVAQSDKLLLLHEKE